MAQKPLYMMGDFETTVYEGQTETEVWAAACVELYTEDVAIFNSLPDWFNYLCSFDRNVVCYFHNLKFDGEFILSYLLKTKTFRPAFVTGKTGIGDGYFLPRKDMKSGMYSYSVSARAQWYSITVKVGKHFIDFRDSLKLLPTTVENLGKSFGTKHRKLSMDYEGYRYAGCEITDEERKYIANDVLVVKEALEIMFEEGHKNLTIGSCCLSEYKRTSFLDEREIWDKKFPNLYEQKMVKEQFDSENIGDYIRLSYRGGWCYLVKGRENMLYSNGTTADVNSLYPSMMHSESGNYYPVGMPTFWIGDYIPDIAKDGRHYYFVRIKTEFELKPGKLPCIQIKHDLSYPSTEWLTTSDIKSRVDGLYHKTRISLSTGELRRTWVILTLTMTDFELIQEQYNLINCEILDGCFFDAEIGLFDEYIDKYKKIKMESKGARREIAKLFLNNLYGKMATNTNSSFKYAQLNEDGSIAYMDVPQFDKKPGYIPIGSAITSYARNFTIRAAQANYHGLTKPGFIYADTDSIHCNLPPEKMTGIKVDPVNFCCWKLEACWDRALFVRQKTYLEHVTKENLKPCDPYLNVKCAGMPQKCKDLFILSLDRETKKKLQEDEEFYAATLKTYGEKGVKFLMENQLDLVDFKVGLLIPTGKLLPKHISGGIILQDSPFEMRRKFL